MKKVLIIGGGLAGATVARTLEKTCDVTIMCKGSRDNSNSMLAQGGIAAAVDSTDSWQQHYQDTLQAGVFENNPEHTKLMVKDGVNIIKKWIAEGLTFDANAQGKLDYGLEGAHSCPRILHIQGDQTGKYLTKFVHHELKNVCWLENSQAVQLIVKNNVCSGVAYLNFQGEYCYFKADVVVLAMGGCGGLYPLTSNDSTITGSGVALAKRAGAKIKDMEFIQFHPTMLVKNNHCYGLISEAVRGKGGILVDENNRKIMEGKHPRKDLAPRDVVSRILAAELAAGHHLFLDIEQVPNFSKNFPQITANLIKQQIPFEVTHKIPVQPGAHFTMGGVLTDDVGATTIDQLYAVGETACTGVHGANRLASNSLLECVVYATRAANKINSENSNNEFFKTASCSENLTFNLQTDQVKNSPTCEANSFYPTAEENDSKQPKSSVYEASILKKQSVTQTYSDCQNGNSVMFQINQPIVQEKAERQPLNLEKTHKLKATDKTSEIVVQQLPSKNTVTEKGIENQIELPQREELIEKAWESIGICRSVDTLAGFIAWLAQFDFKIYPTMNKQQAEIADLGLVAQIIAESALKRSKSVGAHYMI